jgi:hypothetical protein
MATKKDRNDFFTFVDSGGIKKEDKKDTPKEKAQTAEDIIAEMHKEHESLKTKLQATVKDQSCRLVACPARQ